MKNISMRLSLALGLIGAAGLLAACGDNLHPGGNNPPDANTGDDDIDAGIDGGTAVATVGSTLAVSDVQVLDPEAAALGGIRGGAISLSFTDLTTGGGTPIFGTSPIGGCVITEFDATHTPNPALDSGPIIISGDGLLKTVGPPGVGACTFQAAFGGYVCISDNGAGATALAQDLGPAGGSVSVMYIFPGENFDMSSAIASTAIARVTNVVTVTTAAAPAYAVGMFVTIAGADASFNTPAAGPGFRITATTATTISYAQAGADEVSVAAGTTSVPTGKLITSVLNINGFATAAFNSGTSAFPVIGAASANTLIALNPTPTDGQAAPATATNYAVLNGFTPIPTGGLPGALFNFLGDATTDVTITKAADAVWPALNQTVYVRGEGWALDAVSANPANVDLATAAPLRFGCNNNTPADDTDDTCGSEDSTAPLEATIISGRATKGDLTGLQAFQMPTEVPGTSNWLEWQCAFILNDVATMPTEAVQKIIDFAPTRVEFRVLRVSGALIDGVAPNQMRLLVGHGVVGHTDPT